MQRCGILVGQKEGGNIQHEQPLAVELVGDVDVLAEDGLPALERRRALVRCW